MEGERPREPRSVSVGPLLEVRNLELRRGQHPAVRGVSFAMRPGEFVAVMGRSGAGKTTLLHGLTGLLAPSGGEVHWADRCQGACCAGIQPRLRPQRQAVMFQHYRLVPQLSAIHNVLCGRLGEHAWWRTLAGFPAADKAGARAWLDRLGLGPRATLPARRLSGGEQQRVAVARAMIQEPSLLLADEPVASLDAETANQVMQLFRQRNQETGLTVLCVLHDVDMAERFADRILLLEQGQLVYDGPARGLQGVLKEKLQWQTLL